MNLKRYISASVISVSSFFSISCPLAYAAIVDLGVVTRDTSTGLEWLDLTESVGFSVVDVNLRMEQGGEFEGWRYATLGEVQELWMNLGVSDGTLNPIQYDTSQFLTFSQAVELLGNVSLLAAPIFTYGTVGITGSPLAGFPGSYITTGMYHIDGAPYTTVAPGDDGLNEYINSFYHGSYLVRQVPLPPAIWLLLAALGAVKVARLRRPKA